MNYYKINEYYGIFPYGTTEFDDEKKQFIDKYMDDINKDMVETNVEEKEEWEELDPTKACDLSKEGGCESCS